MAPRQRATFDKKGKVKSMNYKEYSPRQEKASAQLESYIRNNQDKKNEAPGIKSILQDMPQKKADFVRRNVRKDGTLNSAAQALLAPYRDERPEYSRQLNRLVKSSPEMAQAYEKRFPIQNFMQNVAPRFMPGIGQLFSADQGMKANAAKQAIMNTPVNRPEGGFKNFVDFFKKDMTGDQAAKINIIETENKPFVNPQDMNLQKAQPFVSPADMNLQETTPFKSPQDMGFLDDENIFDTEKAAIDAALAPGDIFDPVAADKQSKVDFINKVENTNYTVQDAEKTFNNYGTTIDEQFERSKQKQGGIIREEVNRDLNVDDEDPIPGGQFNLTSPTVNEDTVPIILGGDPNYDFSNFNTNTELGNLSENPNLFPEGGVSGTPVTQAGQELVFTDGTPVTEPFDTGLDMVGDKAFPNSPGSQTALDILNSNATDGGFSGQPTLRYNFADGGSTNKYQNMSTREKLMRMAETMYG
jgi:hypothetical protein